MNVPHPVTRWRTSLTIMSVLLFGAALTQPAFFRGAQAASSGAGWRLLLQGWRGVPLGYVEWLANPALLVSWIAAGRAHCRLSAASACCAATLMLAFLARRTLASPFSASGTQIVSHGAGYWLWLGSALLMVVANIRGCRIGCSFASRHGAAPDAKDLP